MIELDALSPMETELTPTDLKILKILQKNARKSYQDIASEIGGVTSATIRNRMNRMSKIGVIKSFKACINPSALGYDIKAFVDISLTAPKYIGKVHEIIKAIPGVHQIFPFSGQFQLRIQVFANTMQDYGRIITRISQLEEVREIKSDIIMDLPTFRSEISL
ncbi:MAG: Lrp/AsnC family transcriptional regulator [Candidatus Helarchaeota archaeon]